MKRIIVFILFFFPSALWASDEGTFDIRDKMTMREFTEAGLNKLSSQEMDALNKWLNDFVTAGESFEGKIEKDDEAVKETKKEEKGYLGSLFGGSKNKEYKIKKIESDRRFRINNNNFTSNSVCPGYSEGDKIIFTEGRADGMCETAEFTRPDGSDSCVVFCR